MKGGIEKLSEQVSDLLDAQMQSCFAEFIARGGSPIEAIFEFGMIFGCRYAYSLVGFDCDREIWLHDVSGDDLLADDFLSPFHLKQSRQETLLDWPVDFAFALKGVDGKVYRAVVECDGHDFHERTKEQAARDRSRDRRLQAEGYRIFRFTGAELWRDPMACVKEVVLWAQSKWIEVEQP